VFIGLVSHIGLFASTLHSEPLWGCELSNIEKGAFAFTGLFVCILFVVPSRSEAERGGAGVKTQKMVRGEIGGWGRVPFNETYAPSLSTIYDGA